ncbi:3993_t:CDS:2, partial [Racocetra persica]
ELMKNIPSDDVDRGLYENSRSNILASQSEKRLSNKSVESSKSACAYNRSYMEIALVAPTIESRRGAPLLKHLHLKQSEEETMAKYVAMLEFCKDLEKMRILIDLVHRREKEKLKRDRLQ